MRLGSSERLGVEDNIDRPLIYVIKFFFFFAQKQQTICTAPKYDVGGRESRPHGGPLLHTAGEAKAG